jgi:muramoyltetrapeptide carboxypeptidase LdcA involved in peptidoglycan recycling
LLQHNPGWQIFREGEAAGTIIGGNLGTLHLLHGTEYIPSIEGDIILFIEDDREDHPAAFDRHLQSLLYQSYASRIRGVVIGRCEKASGITNDIVKKIVDSKTELSHVPVIYGLDFGHTTPMITFPIGGKAELVARGGSATLCITEH